MAAANVTARTIRYYDSEGLLGDVQRSIGYTRYFSDETIDRIKEIKKLKKKKYKIEEIKALFKQKGECREAGSMTKTSFVHIQIVFCFFMTIITDSYVQASKRVILDRLKTYILMRSRIAYLFV